MTTQSETPSAVEQTLAKMSPVDRDECLQLAELGHARAAIASAYQSGRVDAVREADAKIKTALAAFLQGPIA